MYSSARYSVWHGGEILTHIPQMLVKHLFRGKLFIERLQLLILGVNEIIKFDHGLTINYKNG